MAIVDFHAGGGSTSFLAVSFVTSAPLERLDSGEGSCKDSASWAECASMRFSLQIGSPLTSCNNSIPSFWSISVSGLHRALRTSPRVQ
ncbi:hypothetical protein AYI69_g9055 [Smittium culicis]|uniref:Uncharacterized protein n=1 Tax=Smittium culicis TaxID=133412 RepID=A0A1R1XF89_9FUNG|nr:hypothetical protein AYI69_g9055 [Smittium culicis]